jgi:hypothetical protein
MSPGPTSPAPVNPSGPGGFWSDEKRARRARNPAQPSALRPCLPLAGVWVVTRGALRATLACCIAAASPALAADAVPPDADRTPAPSEPAASEDGWPDLSDFLDGQYGFLPVAIPITEPAVGYGVGGGVAFISKPLAETRAGLGRPSITFAGGMATENGTWGAAVGDLRYWLDDRVQTLAGIVHASVNLDFHGIGQDSVLADQPLRYNLEPTAGALQARYRFGDTRLWAGLSYAFAVTDVSFDAPAATPGLPDYDSSSRLGGLTASISQDTRDNFFTPVRGTYLQASVAVFAEWLGGDDAFQRVSLSAIQYFALLPSLFLGVRGDAAASFGDAPFYMRPFISLRGVPMMRYQGEETAQAEAELRWQFYKRLSVLGFAGGGVAWNDFVSFDDALDVLSGGGGFRYEVARRYGLHMGLDIAFSRDTTAIYLQVGSAWMRP